MQKIKLDRNGYAPSIFPMPDNCCAICLRTDRPLQRHEVFHGANRAKSKALGCWVHLCYECHMKLHQKDNGLDRRLKHNMQRIAMREYGWSIPQFRERFGKNYLDE